MTGVRRWPLLVIAAPAAVSIWSGWVGLGGLCGFGRVEPLPGLLPFHIDTALTLPLGIESYAALALGTWLRSGTRGHARTFARGSALGALVLGMLGQVSYHLLAASHARRAPDLVIVLVACLPVVVLGCAVALLHLLAAEPDTAADRPGEQSADRSAEPVQRPARTGPQTVTRTDSQTGPDIIAEPVRGAGTNRSAGHRANRSADRSTVEDAEREFAAEIAAGTVPSLYLIRTRLHVGNERAKALRQHIARQALAA